MQSSLFDENMESFDQLVHLKSNAKTKGVKQDFYKALQKSRELKARIDMLKKMAVYAHQVGMERIEPLESAYVELLKEEFSILKSYLENPSIKLGRVQRENLLEVLIDKAGLLANRYHCDEYMSYVEEWSSMDHMVDEEEKLFHLEAMAAGLKEIFGIDVDPSDLDGTPDFEKLREKYGSQMEEAFRQNSEPKPRKKSKKQLEKEAIEKEQEKLLTKDIKVLYRELAIQLHPDREPDEALKAEKEELMKQLTKAKEEDDLFELLRLHMEHLDDAGPAKSELLPEDTLRRFLKLIREKNREKEAAIDQLLYNTPLINSRSALRNEESLKMAIDHSVKNFIKHFKAQSEIQTRINAQLKLGKKELNYHVKKHIDASDSFFIPF